MKKTMSYLWKVGLVLVIAGGILSVVAWALGGAEAWESGPIEAVEELPVRAYEGVKSLEIEISMGNVVIEQGDSFTVRGTAGESTVVQQTFEDGRLQIEEELSRNSTSLWKVTGLFWNSPNSPARQTTELIVTIPEGYELEELEIVAGAGDLQLQGLEVTKKMDIEVGAGYAELFDYQGSGETRLECGAGEIQLTGQITGQMDLECGAGQISVYLDGLEEEYSYQVECGIGDVQVGDQGYSNLGAEAKVTMPNAKGELDIECGVGQVLVHFTGNQVE